MVQICRTCMKEITDAFFFYLDFTPLPNIQLTIRQTLYSCIPELELSIVPNPVMCRKCVANLLSVFEFKKNCLQLEVQINTYIQQVQHTGDLNLVEIVQFYHPNSMNMNIEVKMEDIEIIEDSKNEDLVYDSSAFNEESECTVFHQPDIKNLDVEVKMKDLEITEVKIEHPEITKNFKNQDLVCDTGAFNEASECTELKYLLELQKLNTFDDYNINYNLSAAEENSNTHNSNIAQNCLQEVTEQDHNNCSKNLNKTNAYYQCHRCGHKAKSKLKLILHLKRHTQKNFYHEKIIKSRRLSRYHKKGICYYRCSLCNYLTKYKCLFDFHIRIHLIKKNHKHIFNLTNVHTNAFATTIKVNKSNTKGNKRKLVKNCNKPFSLSVCEYQCSQKSQLKQHMEIHTGEKPFICSICEYQCNDKGNLKKHILIHTKEKPFSCSVCEYQCNQKCYLRRHMRIHTKEKPLSCSVCEYRCSYKGSLKIHMRIHTGEKPFACCVCEYQCSQKCDLKKHILIHTREKPFSCFLCEYQCSQKGDLKRHMRIHTEEKPFSCSVCEYRCSHKSSLKIHMLIHTGDKPFSCSVCEYQCRKKDHLKQHMRIHTGEKPFSCSVCEYRCNDKGNLKKHVLIHTGEKPFSCSVCEYQCSQKSHLKKHNMRIHML